MTAAPDALATRRDDLLALDRRKEALQDEAEAIVSELTAEPPGGGQPIGIDTPLVDAEGYPRGDIDVFRARTLRKRFKEIQTDHKALERKLSAGLIEIAALSNDAPQSVSKTTAKEDEEERRARLAPKPKPKFDAKTGKWVVKSWDGSVAGVEDGETRSFENLSASSNAALAGNVGGRGSDAGGSGAGRPQPTGTGQRPGPRASFDTAPTEPFAIIDKVSPNSPASQAGLEEGDLIVKFGHVDSRTLNGFRAIAELVPDAAQRGAGIAVTVRRNSKALGGLAEVIQSKAVELRPRTWSGRGMLGCHIRPYSE